MKNQNRLIAAAVAVAIYAPAYAAEVTVSGAVEFEASSVTDTIANTLDPTVPENTTDFVVATAAIALEAAVNDRVSATIALLYEEDDTPLGLDEAFITLKANDTTSIVAGKMFVPFGNFESNMVSDPMTLEMGETGETALMVAMESGNVSGSLYTFNGDMDEDAEIAKVEDAALSFGAYLDYATDNMSFGASYISNIADSDGFDGIGAANNVKNYVAGMGVHFSYVAGSFSLLGEHVAAMDDFVATDFGGGVVATKAMPAASNVEIAFDTGSAVIAAGYQMTSEGVEFGMPETVTSVAVSFDVMDGAGLGIEYRTADDYTIADNGTGESTSSITAQLAVEF